MAKMKAGEEEARLLATVGGTVASMDTYESSVLRQATLDTAPKLTGIGFPTLESMLPSYNIRTKKAEDVDVPHVRSVLSKTRSALGDKADDTSNETMVLRLKEQILLSYLKQKLPPDEMPILPIREAAMEKQWSSKLKSECMSQGVKNAARLGEKDANRTGESVSQRLQRIRNDTHSVTSASSTAAFGKQALLEREQRISRKRMSMMERKNVKDDSLQDDNGSETMELLRQRRQERRERKRRRRKRWAEADANSEEIEFDDDTENKEKIDEIRVDEETQEQVEGNNETVTCPICDQTIQVASDSSDIDEVLSRHMDECQRRGRRRRTATVVNDDLADEQNGSAGPAKRKSTTVTKQSPKSKPAMRHRCASPKVALDDMDEYDYEDRVDEWLESGVENMRDMEERDQNESPPGACEFPGGLIIPAWMNNRLFPYQRTGLRWMWELHTQDAGGIGEFNVLRFLLIC